jgi:RNA polymerase sigma factor (sigma-70 family)
MPEVNSNDAASNDSVLEPIVYVPGQTTRWNASWRELYDKLGDVILLYARQGGLNEHSAQDVLQEVMVTVMCAQRGEAAGYDPAKGSFRKWLKGVVRNRIRSVRRRDQRENPLPPPGSSSDDEHGPTLPEVPQLPDDIEDMDERHWQRAILAAALQRVRDRVNPENFAIFMALLEEKASPEQLAKVYGKKTNNIYRIKNSCQTMLAAEARVIQEVWGYLRRIPS